MKTKVGIVGAGPSGLLLSQLLHRAGIESVVVEQRSRSYVEARIRAGVLEQVATDLLDECGVGARMRREGLVHDGFDILFDGTRHRVDMKGLTGGKSVMVYGQTEVTKDLIDARAAEGGKVVFEAEGVAVHDFMSGKPRITYKKDGKAEVVECDFIAGCDGFHGVCRQSVPQGTLRTYEKVYPYGWLGILSRTPPVSHELIYVSSERGFALFSMRSAQVSRIYIQCAPDEDVEKWPDDRFWDEAKRRLDPATAAKLVTGPSIEKSVTPMRSFVAEPMRFGQLFLAGDAAHIVPPTGAKGLNLAATDVRVLSKALIEYYGSGRTQLMDAYSEICLRRIWKAERFSWWMTSLMHFPADGDMFQRQMQLAEMRYLFSSRAAMTALAENYVGLPLEGIQ
jgi:p-hydroxybenzoate 3-monooxygenase